MNKITPQQVIEARERAGLTKKAAALTVGVVPTLWGYYESGRSPVRSGLYELFLIKTEQHEKYGDIEEEIAEMKDLRQKLEEVRQELQEERKYRKHTQDRLMDTQERLLKEIQKTQDLEEEIFNLQGQVNALTEGVQ